MNDTQQRFLRMIAERVPVERIVELHLFAPIRQGGTETGVAVFAALTDVQEGVRAADAAEAADAADAEVRLQDERRLVGAPVGEPSIDALGGEEPPMGPPVEEPGRDVPSEDPPPDPSPAETPPPDDPAPGSAPIGDPAPDGPPMEAPPMPDAPMGDPPQGTPAAMAATPAIPLAELLEMTPVPADGEDATDAAESRDTADVAAEATPPDDGTVPAEAGESVAGDARTEDEPVAAATRPPVVRHVVMSARYRLTLKGVDRGKWEVDVVEEADAPLITVDKVVRGVQRRAGDLADVERFTSDTLQQALSETLWATKT